MQKERDYMPVSYTHLGVYKRQVHVEDRLNTNELFRKHYDLSEKEQKATERAQRKVKKATGKTLPKKSVKAPAPPMKSK